MNAARKNQESINEVYLKADVIRLTVPAQHKFLNVVGTCIRALITNESNVSDRDTLIYNIELAVHEACANIVEHAYAGLSGRIEVAFTLVEEPRRFIVELGDNGRSFDLSTVSAPDLTKPQTGGYGLFLVHQLMDKVDYYPEPGNNHWRLVKQY
ncbi:MAG: ATP-binding protein [Anaerolineae bacterium]|nr:ATP-binding protein [Anaerolineae bacterium]